MQSPTTTAATTGWDRLGIGVSTLCVVHCFLTPLIFALPLIGSVHYGHGVHGGHGDPGDLAHWLHPLFAALVTPVAGVAMLRTAPAPGLHGRRSLLGVGLGLVLVALPCSALGGETPGSLLTLAGSLLLIVGHRWRSGCPAPDECPRKG